MDGWKAFGALIGRVLLVLIFLNSGIGKIGNFEGTAQYMAKAGMPFAPFFLIGAICFELAGSLCVGFGLFARFGALLLALFLIPTTLIFHTRFADPIQWIMFMKNVSMFGGCLFVLASGPGRYSLDTLLRGNRNP